MKEYVSRLVRGAPSAIQARNLAREYLQARILGVLQKSGAMIPLAFHGGTALRFLYGHGRFSEDLDFSLAGDKKRYEFLRYLEAVRSEFRVEGYSVELKAKDTKTVNSAFVRFPGLLFELGLSGYRDEVLAVKIEVDTNPPQGAEFDTTIVRRYVLLNLHHHDKASLFAGKIHAVLQRAYTKGRDMYDLLWYLSDPAWPQPNLVLLNNALIQSNWPGGTVTESNWREQILARIKLFQWKEIQSDVEPFIEPGFHMDLLTYNNLEHLLTHPRRPYAPAPE